MTGTGDGEDALRLDPGFAARFEAQPRPACQLYLISPPALASDFPVRLARAIGAGPVAAFHWLCGNHFNMVARGHMLHRGKP